MDATNQAEVTESFTPAEAVAIVATLHSDTLGMRAEVVTSERAETVMARTNVQTTTELLLLLARFHQDVDDSAGAAMLAEFAVRFAAVESKVV